MVWSRASLVVGVQQHGGLARRLWHSPVAAVSAAAVAKAAPLHCCRLPRHRLTTPRRLRRNCRAALLHGCTAAPICCAAPAAAVTAYCRTAPPRRSVTAPLLPLIVAPLRILPRRRAAPAAAPRRSAAAASLSCCCPTPPPTALLLPRRSSTLPRCSAPRRSASLCYMLPALHRAASLLPRCFAAAAPLRYCRSTARRPLGFQNMLANEDR